MKEPHGSIIPNPLDWWMLVQENWNMVEFRAFLDICSPVMAAMLNLLHVYIKLRHQADDIFSTTHPLEYMLILISFGNTLVLFMATKTMVLYNQPIEPSYAGDTTWIVKSPNATITSVPLPDGTTTRKWVISRWNPQHYQIVLFSLFSPPQVLALYCLDAENWALMPPLSYFTGAMVLSPNQVFLLTRSFQEFVRDTEILAGQVLGLVQDSTKPKVVRMHDFDAALDSSVDSSGDDTFDGR